MESTQTPHPLAGSGLVMAPIHSVSDSSPLRICVLLRSVPDPAAGAFVLLREMPGAQVYLGAVCDIDARIQEWVEVWVQSVELRDLTFSGHQELLTNQILDQRWLAEHESAKVNAPALVIITGMETRNPSPVVIKRHLIPNDSVVLPAEPSRWRLCKDDELLVSFELPAYTTSPFRYLYDPGARGAKTFLTTAPDAPANAHVQSLDRLKTAADATEVFNSQSGLIRVMRFSPLGLEEYLQVLEGRSWQALGPNGSRWFQKGIYADLETWSAGPRGMPFLLHAAASSPEGLNEIFFLKLSALLGMFKEVRAYVKAHQLPLLNLAPESFRIRLKEVGEQFPALWSAQTLLVRSGQAHPLKIKSTEQKYFLRLGKVVPSPFLPEGLGAHSFGIGSVRRRNVITEADGTVLEGTLVAEEYLRLDPHDLLWFKLPVGDERFEFCAHVYTAEAVGPKEARFRTVPTKLPDAVAATLKTTVAFAKAPYEVWPLLSSPCDMHSLGIIAIRVLLANSKSNLPVIVDDILGLARHVGKDPEQGQGMLPGLQAMLEKEPKLFELVSPCSLVEREWTQDQARSQIYLPLWLETIAWLLRLFPGAGAQSYCKSFGDVSPLALETIFDAPVQELEQFILRLRSLLVPSIMANEEIADVILEQLSNM
jgi:hypothetical protein